MKSEYLVHQSVQPMKQESPVGCVPTCIAMVFSGFGVELTERGLIEGYFPNAGLPVGSPDAGVSNERLVTGMVEIVNDLGLEDQLQVDVFAPTLYVYTNSPENRYIVKVSQNEIGKEKKLLQGYSKLRSWYQTLEDLSKRDEIGVYTANNRLMKINPRSFTGPTGDSYYRFNSARDGFYREFVDFIRRGHIVGPHGGMTLHARVLDGTQTTEENFLMIDPRGEEYEMGHSSIIWCESDRISGDTFDYLFRLSPREPKSLTPSEAGLTRFVKSLRSRLTVR